MEEGATMTENELQKRIMVAVSPLAAIFRSPAGMYYQGRRQGDTLTRLRAVRVLTEGFPDLVGWRRSDGRMVLIEIKTTKGKATDQQLRFIELAKADGCLAGIARSEEDAIRIITEDT